RQPYPRVSYFVPNQKRDFLLQLLVDSSGPSVLRHAAPWPLMSSRKSSTRLPRHEVTATLRASDMARKSLGLLAGDFRATALKVPCVRIHDPHPRLAFHETLEAVEDGVGVPLISG